MKTLFSNFKGYRIQLVLGPLFKFCEALMELFVPIIMAQMIDVGILRGDKQYILQNGFALLLIAALGLLFALLCQYFAARVAHGFAKSLRRNLFAHVFRLSPRDYAHIGEGGLITRLTSDVNQVQTGINMFIRLATRAPFLAVGSVVMAFSIHVPTALIFLVSTPLILFVLYKITQKNVPVYSALQGAQDKMSRSLGENLAGVRVIRAFTREAAEAETFAEEAQSMCTLSVRAGKLSALLSPVTGVIVNFAIVAILYFGAGFVDVGALSPGMVLALVNYMTQTMLALFVVANILAIFTRALASAKRLAALMETAPSMHFPDDASSDAPANVQPNAPTNIPSDAHMHVPAAQTPQDAQDVLRFQDVSFAYTGGEAALSHVSFTLKKGETLGIIGGTGSGKTTVMNLILRFFDADSGQILLQNHDVKALSKQALRGQIAYVPQNPTLFSGTVRENLLMGAADANDAALWRALTAAQGAAFVRDLPEGLDTVLTEGGKNLSGGQKQRLAIARALLTNAPLLLLDDASSALDYVTDAALREALCADAATRATVMITQRAAALVGAQAILVLDDGQVAGLGTHAALLQSCAVYQEICASQGLLHAEVQG